MLLYISIHTYIFYFANYIHLLYIYRYILLYWLPHYLCLESLRQGLVLCSQSVCKVISGSRSEDRKEWGRKNIRALLQVPMAEQGLSAHHVSPNICKASCSCLFRVEWWNGYLQCWVLAIEVSMSLCFGAVHLCCQIGSSLYLDVEFLQQKVKAACAWGKTPSAGIQSNPTWRCIPVWRKSEVRSNSALGPWQHQV